MPPRHTDPDEKDTEHNVRNIDRGEMSSALAEMIRVSMRKNMREGTDF